MKNASVFFVEYHLALSLKALWLVQLSHFLTIVPLKLCLFPCTDAHRLKFVCYCSFDTFIYRVTQCFSPRGCEGITPEQFWANSERLVDLAKGGDRIAFDEVISTLRPRHKKIHAVSGSAGSAERQPQGGLQDGGAPTEGNTMSSAEGGAHDRTEQPWQPGGPELHAVLGATGEEAGWCVTELCTVRMGISKC